MINTEAKTMFSGMQVSLGGALLILLMILGLQLGLADTLRADELPPMVVSKTPTCGCCGKWVEHMQASGFDVEVRNMPSTNAARAAAGVPWKMSSCHTAVVGGYAVEGHVPADLVIQLLAEKPDDIIGLAAPGMPMGSPGMEGPNPDRYDVLAFDQDGNVSVYATRDGKNSP
jgi:hypothetical protein